MRRIQSLTICTRCKGSLEVKGEPCGRCDGHGIDPDSYRGCVHDEDCGPHPAGEQHDTEGRSVGGGFRPAGA